MTRIVLTAAGLGLLAGCASVNPQPSFTDVQRKVADRNGQKPEWARSAPEAAALDEAIQGLLKDDLTPETAVQVAILNNPSLQATFEEVGISQADLAHAALVQNPDVSGFARFAHGGPGTNTEFSLVQNVFDIFVAPLRKKLAAAVLEQTKARVAHEVLSLAAEVKSAYFTLQARQQLVERLRLILDITQTAEDFARRQYEAGAIADLTLENQIALNREAKVDVARAEAEVRVDRERLNRLLGVWGPSTAWTVADRLPEIPETEIPLGGLEALAIVRRQDVQAARWGVDLVGRALALRKKTRFFPIGLNVGINTEKDATGERVTGPELTLQLPIFDTGRASIARLTAEHRRAQRQLEALAVNARSEVRESRDRMLAARDLSRYYGGVLLPQRVRILDLTLRYYNMMFKGAYDLLLAKQAEVETERAYIEAWRDYWIARADLERGLGGALPAAGPAVTSSLEEK
jgi:outer membrane protein, heavy metal efflux system